MSIQSFENLKSGFREYLAQLSTDESSNSARALHVEKDTANASIFMYADEFKDYLVDVVGCDRSIKYKNVSDIMKMQLVDGKLVESSKVEQNEDTEEAQSLAELEIEAQKEEQATEDESQEVEETVSQEQVDKYLKDNKVNMSDEDSEIFTDTFNILLADEDFLNTVKGDSDDIGDKEISAFFDVVKEYDKDEKNLSTEDLLLAASDIQEGMFEKGSDKVIDETFTPEQIESVQQAAAAAGMSPQMAASSPSRASSQIAASAPTTSAKRANASAAVAQNYSGTRNIGGESVHAPSYSNLEDSVKGMSIEELQAELTKSQGELATKQGELSDIDSGADSVIKGLKDQEETAYDEYQNQLQELDEDLASKLDEAKVGFDEAQLAYDENATAISNQQVEVSKCETELASANSEVSALESQLSGMKEKNEDGTTNENYTAIKSALEEAKAKEEQAKAALEKAKSELEALQEKQTELEEAYAEAAQALDDIEQEISEKHPEVNEAQQAWQDAKTETITKQQELKSAKQEEITEVQNHINEIQTALSAAQTSQTIRENSDTNGDAVVAHAYEFLGMSESQVESNTNDHKNLPDGLWCAAFVNEMLRETYGVENLPAWYNNCNSNSCSEVLRAANNNGQAFTDGSQAQCGDLIIFNTSRGTARHIGFVVSVDADGTIHTIEGNSGSKVSERTYNIKDIGGRVNSFVRVA